MRELRHADTTFELRSTEAGNTLEGYAAIFGAEADIYGLFREQIAPGAFDKTIRESDVRALFNHDPSLVLGRTKAGTLRLETDDRGLRYEIDLPNTQTARDLWTLVDRGDVSQSSFAFEAVLGKEEWQGGDPPLRILREVRLWDVSPVTYPAYEATVVQARALLAARELRGVASELLPLADKGGGWNAADAIGRVREWAGGDDWDPIRYRRAFLWWDDAAPELLGSYKLPIGDIRGERLVAVPEGIYAAAQRLDNTDIPSDDREAVRRTISRYYQAMGETDPWSRAATTGQPADEPPSALVATEQPELVRLRLQAERLRAIRTRLTILEGIR